MDDIVLDIIEGVADLIECLLWNSNSNSKSKSNYKRKKRTKKTLVNRVVKSVNKRTVSSNKQKGKEAFLNVIKGDRRQDYITALIGTSVALSYADDGKLDRHEKQMISELLKRYKYDLSKETKKNIRYIKRHKMNQRALISLYKRLNIHDQTVLKITSNLNSLIMYGEKDVTRQKAFLKSINEQFSNEMDQNAVGF